MKTNNHKHIWIVTGNAFQYGWMGSTKRILSIARALNLLGINTSLVSSKIVHHKLQPSIDAIFPGKVFRNQNFGPYPKIIENDFFKKITRGFYRLRGDQFYWNKVSCGWGDRLKNSEIEIAERTLGKPDLIWGVCGGLLEGGIAASKISQYFGCDLIYELHDPPLRTMPEFGDDCLQNRFNEIIDSSNSVIVNAENYLEYLIKARSLFSADKFVYIPQCYETSSKFKNKEISTCMTLGYFGSLNKPRSLLPILEAIRFPLQHTDGTYFKIKLIFAGGGDSVHEAIDYVKKFKMNENFEYVGQLPPDKMSEYEDLCDAIIVMQARDYKYEVPGKVVEAIGKLQTILALADKDSETGNVITKYPLGILSDSGNILNIRDSLKYLRTIKSSGDDALNAAHLYARKFSSDVLLDKLKSEILFTEPPLQNVCSPGLPHSD